jgi:ParB family chromosome partitioning protein
MADKKGGLGRGIGALIPTAPAETSRPSDIFFGGGTPANTPSTATDLMPVPGMSFRELDLDAIVPNHNQPRTEFNQGDMDELVHSIREFGVLQPIVVRSLPNENNKFELIMGERRWRASRLAGKTTIPVVVRETANENMLRDALLENLHRSDLNPLEEASAYQQLMADFGITQDALSAKIGRSRPQISNTIRLLNLPGAVQLKVAGGALSAGQARAILAAKSDERMQHWANKAINENLTVRQLEEQIAIDTDGVAKKKGKTKAGSKTAALDELAQLLGDALDTRAKIKLGKKNGEIKIEFATMADLFRILDKFGIKRNL